MKRKFTNRALCAKLKIARPWLAVVVSELADGRKSERLKLFATYWAALGYVNEEALYCANYGIPCHSNVYRLSASEVR